VAVLFAREGADVTIVYLPEEEEDARETKKLVEGEGKKCLLVPGNLMDNETCKKAVQQHMDTYGGLHVLVNNASKQIMCENFAEIDLDNVESTFRSNILQMFALTKYALPHMEKGGSWVSQRLQLPHSRRIADRRVKIYPESSIPHRPLPSGARGAWWTTAQPRALLSPSPEAYRSSS
jgi:NAD(P)-dependent dehydrogenase (short-subunit alcohol dehydrogenase family)